MKRKVDDLAIFGGSAEFTSTLHVGRPNIPNIARLLKRIEGILDSKWLTYDGPYLQQFEKRIADMIGVRNCVATCNGTGALEILVRAAGLKGEVIVPSFTFVATAHALQWLNVKPVFADVELETHNVDPDHLEHLITKHTTAILGVHLWGRPCRTERLQKIAEEKRLRLFYDASHAFGCSHHGRMIGSFGDAEVFSFHATKFLNTFEGGAIVTNDDQLAERMRLMRSFGFNDYDSVISVGANGKLNEVSAAMGISCLEEIETFIAVNRRNYQIYRQRLSNVPGLTVLHYDEIETNNFQYIVMVIEEETFELSRDDVLAILWKENILARRYFFPGIHAMEPYRSLYPNSGRNLPITERLVKQVLCFPTGTSINTEDVTQICDLLEFIIEKKDSIRRRLTNTSLG